MKRKLFLYLAVLIVVLSTAGCTWIGTLLNGPAIGFTSGGDGYGRVAYAPSLSFSGAVTVEAWVRVHAITNWASFVTKGSTVGEYSLRLDDSGAGHLRFSINDQGTINYCDSSATLSLDSWHHVAATYDGANMRLYVDGKADGVLATTTPVVTNTEDLFLGFDSPGAAEYLDGDLAEVRIWNVARTATDIQADMDKRLIGTEPGLVLLCHLSEGSGTQFAESVHGVKGALTGSYEWIDGPAALK
jgi:hypothetical protein